MIRIIHFIRTCFMVGSWSLCLALLPASSAQEDVTGRFAVITDIQGTVSTSYDGGTNWQKAMIGDFLEEGDWVRTDSSATATLVFDTSYLNTITVQQESSVLIEQLRNQAGTDDPDYSLNLNAAGGANGEIYVLLNGLQTGDLFQVRTPSAIIAARGTEFVVNYSATGSTQVEVVEGNVEMTPVSPATGSKGAAQSRSASNDVYYADENGTAGVYQFATSIPDRNRRDRIEEFKLKMNQVRAEIAALKTQIDLVASEEEKEQLKEKLHLMKKWVSKMTQSIRKMRTHQGEKLPSLVDRPWTEGIDSGSQTWQD